MLSRRSILRARALAVGAPMINRGRFSLFAHGETEYSARTVDLISRSTRDRHVGLVDSGLQEARGVETNPDRFQPADYLRLKNSGITVFHPAVGYTEGDVYADSLRDINGWNAFVNAHESRFLLVKDAADFERAKALGKIGILIGQQNSQHFRTVEDVDRFYDLGQRVSQLTYRGNRIGAGSSDARDRGLSEFGAAIVERMNRVGMAVDISHCGDRTSLDTIEASRKPVLVTHSNCRALVPASPVAGRMKPSSEWRQKGGVMGVTMVRIFVRAEGPLQSKMCWTILTT